MSVVLETAYVLVAEGAQGQRYFAGPTAIVREVTHARRFPAASAAEEHLETARRLARQDDWTVARLKIRFELETALTA